MCVTHTHEPNTGFWLAELSMLWENGIMSFTFTHDHISKVAAWVSFHELHCVTGNMWDRHLIMELASRVENAWKYISACWAFWSRVFARVCLEVDLGNLLVSCTPMRELRIWHNLCMRKCGYLLLSAILHRHDNVEMDKARGHMSNS